MIDDVSEFKEEVIFLLFDVLCNFWFFECIVVLSFFLMVWFFFCENGKLSLIIIILMSFIKVRFRKGRMYTGFTVIL